MTRTAASALAAAALLLAACGGYDGDEKSEQGQAQSQQAQQPKRSALDCLDQSVLSPERHTDAKSELEGEVRPLITSGAQASTILGGDELGGVVIEYPDVAAAGKAYDKARESKKLSFLGNDQIALRGKVLFLDYSEDAHIKKIVRGCAENPDQPPPTP